MARQASPIVVSRWMPITGTVLPQLAHQETRTASISPDTCAGCGPGHHAADSRRGRVVAYCPDERSPYLSSDAGIPARSDSTSQAIRLVTRILQGWSSFLYRQRITIRALCFTSGIRTLTVKYHCRLSPIRHLLAIARWDRGREVVGLDELPLPSQLAVALQIAEIAPQLKVVPKVILLAMNAIEDLLCK